MKDDEKLARAVQDLKHKAPPYKQAVDAGPESGVFVPMIGVVIEESLKPAVVWRSEATGIYWILPLEDPVFPKALFPAEAYRAWSDMHVDRAAPKAGQLYRHYKGTLYEVVHLAMAMTSDGTPRGYVVYMAKEGQVSPPWVRPLSSFDEVIQVKRFRRESP